jgi:hypothetical protein
MPRAKGAQTLELSADDNAELLALCADHDDAEKKWLGGVFLRYGMKYAQRAMAEQAGAAAQRTRKRRGGDGAG